MLWVIYEQGFVSEETKKHINLTFGKKKIITKSKDFRGKLTRCARKALWILIAAQFLSLDVNRWKGLGAPARRTTSAAAWAAATAASAAAAVAMATFKACFLCSSVA